MKRYSGPRLGDTAFRGVRRGCYCCRLNYITNSAARSAEKATWMDEAWDDVLEIMDRNARKN